MISDEKQHAEDLYLVRVDRLELGWVVDEDIYAGSNVLLKQGTEITAGVLRGIRRRGLSHIQVKPSCELAASSAASEPEPDLAGLLTRAKEIYTQHDIETAIPSDVLELATNEIEDLFREIEVGNSADFQQIRPVVETVVQQFTSRSHMAVKLLDLDSIERYTYRHSLNTGLLFMSIASDWYTNQDQLIDAVFGAILHDIGMARLSSEMLNKPGRLSEEERAHVHKHPVWGHEMLEQAGASPEVMAIALAHHERVDGTGYPHGLKGMELDHDARLVAICDVYDAVTTNRSYKQKTDFALAIDILIQGCGRQFDPVIANHFIRKIGRYPVGTFVILNTDEIAVVRRTNETAISSPVVSRVLDIYGREIKQPEELDLKQAHDVYIVGVVASPQGIPV